MATRKVFRKKTAVRKHRVTRRVRGGGNEKKNVYDAMKVLSRIVQKLPQMNPNTIDDLIMKNFTNYEIEDENVRNFIEEIPDGSNIIRPNMEFEKNFDDYKGKLKVYIKGIKKTNGLSQDFITTKDTQKKNKVIEKYYKITERGKKEPTAENLTSPGATVKTKELLENLHVYFVLKGHVKETGKHYTGLNEDLKIIIFDLLNKLFVIMVEDEKNVDNCALYYIKKQIEVLLKEGNIQKGYNYLEKGINEGISKFGKFGKRIFGHKSPKESSLAEFYNNENQPFSHGNPLSENHTRLTLQSQSIPPPRRISRSTGIGMMRLDVPPQKQKDYSTEYTNLSNLISSKGFKNSNNYLKQKEPKKFTVRRSSVDRQ